MLTLVCNAQRDECARPRHAALLLSKHHLVQVVSGVVRQSYEGPDAKVSEKLQASL